MAVVNWVSISGIIVDIILFFIIAGNAAINYRRGLARVIFSICSTVVAVILVLILYRPITNYVINETSASQKLETIFAENLQYLFEKNGLENTEQMQNDNEMAGILTVFIGDEIGTLIQETADSVIRYLSVQISHKVISVVVFFALFAIIRLLLYVLKSYIELIGDLPIIRVFNGSGGMIYGILKGFLIIYAFFAIISLIMPVISDTIIITAIQNAPIGSKMFNNNILLNLIFKFI